MTLTNTAFCIFVSLHFVWNLTLPLLKTGIETVPFCTGSQLSSRIAWFSIDLRKNSHQISFSCFAITQFLLYNWNCFSSFKTEEKYPKICEILSNNNKRKKGKKTVFAFIVLKEINVMPTLPKQIFLMHVMCLTFSFLLFFYFFFF